MSSYTALTQTSVHEFNADLKARPISSISVDNGRAFTEPQRSHLPSLQGAEDVGSQKWDWSSSERWVGRVGEETVARLKGMVPQFFSIALNQKF